MRSLLFLALPLALGLAACGPTTPTCDFSSCQGCCTADGVCVDGASPFACGSSGSACNACSLGQQCLGGSCFTPQTCSPKSCAQLAVDCGRAQDGCGGTLDCGTCTTGKVCGAGGVANVCGTGTCTPKTCASEGFTCGSASDGCAALLDCGTCAQGSSCGGGGPNKCGACQPQTCATLNKNCGPVNDGCSGTTNCGTCSGNQTCGGGGTPNVCGAGSCAPQTCAQLGKQCGQVDDGCGTMITCGSCTLPQTCGGAGTPNSCGATCTVTCPQGFTCDGQGVCTGGSISTLGFNVVTNTISGTVTLNGVAPTGVGTTGTCASSPRGWVELSDGTNTFSLPIACTGSPAPFTGMVYPGTYKVIVRGNSAYSNLPAQPVVVQQALTVSADVNNLAFDVVTRTVSGTVTLNGAAPSGTGTTGTCASSPRGWVDLNDAANGYSFSLPIACMGAPAPFTGLVYPGTYKVTVRGNAAYSNLPAQSIVVRAALVVSADVNNLAFDVQTFTVSGVVSLNGAAPTGTGTTGTCASSPRGWVDLDDATNGYSFSLAIACMGSPAAFTGLVYPGTYKVTVRGNAAYSNLPAQSVVVQSTLVVNGNVSNLTFDVLTHTVSGTVALNGVAPTGTGTTGTCSSSPRGWVDLNDATNGYSFSLPIACLGSPAPFTGLVYPGTYKVTVRGNAAYSNLPAQSVVVQASLVVNGNVGNLAFDVLTFTVSGVVSLNGAAPTGTGTTGTCASSPRGWVELNDATNGYTFSLPIACMGAPAPFTGLVYPGTYKVTVRGNAAYSNLPAQSVVVQPSLTVNGAVGNLAFEVLTRTVSGTVTLNGVEPTGTGTTGTCASSPRGWVDLHDGTNGYDFSLPIACMGAPAPFTGLVYPGTYVVKVRGNAAYSNLPPAPYTVVQQLRVP